MTPVQLMEVWSLVLTIDSLLQSARAGWIQYATGQAQSDDEILFRRSDFLILTLLGMNISLSTVLRYISMTKTLVAS